MDRFLRAFRPMQIHEGGYVNHPRDPGGATMKGVTQRVYDDYRRRMNQPQKSVRHISDYEVETIYRQQYWNAVKADDLPDGLAYCVFDAAVNSGPGRAARWLQQALGVKVDGIIGNQTVGAARAANAVDVINRYCDMRLAFMKRLRHWPTFKNGWTRRVAEVRRQATEWAASGETPMAMGLIGKDHIAKAEGPEKVTASLGDAIRNPYAITAAGSSIGAVGTALEGDGPVQYALAAALLVVAIGGVVWLIRSQNK